jgi:hypothetical protein
MYKMGVKRGAAPPCEEDDDGFVMRLREVATLITNEISKLGESLSSLFESDVA